MMKFYFFEIAINFLPFILLEYTASEFSIMLKSSIYSF